MTERRFAFEVYRMNIVDQGSLLQESHKPIKTDEDIEKIIKASIDAQNDFEAMGRVRTFKWSLRQFNKYDLSSEGIGTVITVTLARSIVGQNGTIVTDIDIVDGFSEPDPPLADTVEIIIFMKRHIAVVERLSSITGQKHWRASLTRILSTASFKLGYFSDIIFEPKPEKHDIINTFLSFEKIVRLKVHLRLPNPELTRYTKELYDDLVRGGIRDYIQDMKNPRGISKEKDTRPFASVAMAQDGYKEKEVLLEGIRDGKFTKIKTGNEAARGQIEQLKDFVRGLNSNTKTQEAARIMKAIFEELERIAPCETIEGKTNE